MKEIKAGSPEHKSIVLAREANGGKAPLYIIYGGLHPKSKAKKEESEPTVVTEVKEASDAS